MTVNELYFPLSSPCSGRGSGRLMSQYARGVALLCSSYSFVDASRPEKKLQ